MHLKVGYRGIRLVGNIAGLAIALAASAAHAQNPNDPDWLNRNVSSVEIEPHMPEAKRETVDRLVVLSGRQAADQTVDGTYGKGVPGLAGGMAAGSNMGRISKEIGGVPINIPIPGVQLPATIIGGLVGISMAEIQEFRDALTEELTNSDSPPLRNDGIALDAFWTVERLDDYDAELLNPDKSWPEDADAVLLTDFREFSIDVDGNDAVITTSVIGVLNDAATGDEMYRTVVRYQDRDRLEKWTEDDKALWRSYANFARYYLGRAVAADIFSRVDLQYTLQPSTSDDTKFARRSDRRLTSKSLAPTIAWRFDLTGTEGYGTWAEGIDPTEVAFDLEVFDDRQLVYDTQGVAGTSHRIGYEIEPCRTYRWSVRPVFRTGGKTRVGEWMRLPYDDGKKKDKKASKSSLEPEPFGKGLQGREASVAPAYLQDFAELDIACRR